MALSGDGKTLVVGAPNNDGINGTFSGHARVYDWNAGTPGGSVASFDGNISISAAHANIAGTINAAAGAVSFVPTNGRTVDLGEAGGAGQFVLSDAELDLVTTTSGIAVGSASTGNIVFTGAVDLANADTLEIITGGDITQGFAGTVLSGDDLIITGDLAPALTGTGTFTVDGDVTLTEANTPPVITDGPDSDALDVVNDFPRTYQSQSIVSSV